MACVITPFVKNPEGKFVKSILFDTLYNITKDRNLTKRLYNVATSNEFLNSRDVLTDGKFDRNGQIDAHSFLKLSSLIDYTDKEIKSLEEKYGITAPYDEAIKNIEKFNSEYDTSDYVATIDEFDGNMVKVGFTVRDEVTSNKLREQIENNELTKAIADTLRSLGVSYDFIGKNSFNGMFSTRNAQRMSDGLYHLISISQGADVNDAFLEEASHLAVHSLKDSDVVKRLLDLIDSKTSSSLFTQEELDNAAQSNNGKLELAGLLVKKALNGSSPSNYSSFFGKVKDAIFNVFRKANLEKFVNKKLLAKAYARNIAEGLLFNPSMFSIDKALSNPIQLYSLNLSSESKLLKDTLNKIGVMSNKLRNASHTIYTKYQSLTYKSVLKDEDIATVDSEVAAAMVSSSVSTIAENLKRNMDILESVDRNLFHGDIDTEAANILLETVELYNTLVSFQGLMSKFLLNNDPSKSTAIINSVEMDIESILAGGAKGAISRRLLNIERLVTANFLETIIGAPSVRQNARVALDGFGTKRVDAQTYIFYGDEGANRTNVVTTNAEEFNTMFLNNARMEHFASLIKSLTNAKDITVQILNKQLMKVRSNQNRKYNETLAELKNLKSSYKGKSSDFYERTSDGNLSGYFISPINRGQFEFEKRNINARIKEKFIAELKANNELDKFKALPSNRKIAIFEDYKEKQQEFKDWAAEAYDDYATKTISTERYHNKLYDELVEKYGNDFLNTLNHLVTLKRTIDTEELTEYVEQNGMRVSAHSHGVEDAVPMYAGKQAKPIDNIESKFETFDLYKPDPELITNLTSADFGSYQTDVDPDFTDPYSEVRNQMKRIMISGIKRPSDISTISTDIFSTLARYAGMAYKFGTIQNLYSQIEIAVDTLNKREGKSSGVAKEQFESLETRYIYNTIKNDSGSKFFDKMAKVLKSLGTYATLRVLGVSIRGAVKNFGGAYMMTMQDAITGVAPFNMGDLAVVSAKNAANLKNKFSIASSLVLGNEVYSDKWSNLMKRWDSYREDKSNYNEFKYHGFGSLRYLTNLWMANYSTTDNAIMGQIYGASFRHKKLFDSKSGREISALDAYDYDENNMPSIKAGILKDRTSFNYYNLLKAAYEALESYDYTMPITDIDAVFRLYSYMNDANFSMKPIDFDVQKYSVSYSNDDVIELKDKIKSMMDSLCFTREDEFDLLYKVNDYVASAQGTWGLVNAVDAQNVAVLESFGRIKGYLFANIQRNLMSNATINNEDYKNSVFGAELIALMTVIGRNDFHLKPIDNTKLRFAVLYSMIAPWAILDKNTRDFIRRTAGWSDDQFKKMCVCSIGILMQLILGFIAVRFFGRGNQQKVGSRMLRKDAGSMKKIDIEYPGLFYRLIDDNICPLITYDTEKAERATNRFSDDKKDYIEFYEKMAYWKNMQYGYPDDPWSDENKIYSLLGFMYSCTKGFASETRSRVDPAYFWADIKNIIASPIVHGGLISSFVRNYNTAVNTQGLPSDGFGDKVLRGLSGVRDYELNFLLKKVGLKWTPLKDTDGNIISHEIVPMDWYRQQDIIDNMEYRQAFE